MQKITIMNMPIIIKKIKMIRLIVSFNKKMIVIINKIEKINLMINYNKKGMKKITLIKVKKNLL